MPQISAENTSMTCVSPFENGRNENIMSYRKAPLGIQSPVCLSICLLLGHKLTFREHCIISVTDLLMKDITDGEIYLYVTQSI